MASSGRLQRSFVQPQTALRNTLGKAEFARLLESFAEGRASWNNVPGVLIAVIDEPVGRTGHLRCVTNTDTLGSPQRFYAQLHALLTTVQDCTVWLLLVPTHVAHMPDGSPIDKDVQQAMCGSLSRDLEISVLQPAWPSDIWLDPALTLLHLSRCHGLCDGRTTAAGLDFMKRHGATQLAVPSSVGVLRNGPW